MKPERISEIKKELKLLESTALVEICLKLAKFKRDNKEFLNYLLFESANPESYLQSVKLSLQESFHILSRNSYQKTKELRKILRILNKHIKYTGMPVAEVELLLWYCDNLLEHGSIKSSQKALYMLLIRQLQKVRKTILKLHEDLQFDYKEGFNALIVKAAGKISAINEKEFML